MFLVLVAIGCASNASRAVAEDSQANSVSYRNDVTAVLSKAGCNAGVCHGNKNGKGGFKLSLRGEDPARDFQALTREQSGRRINTLAPHRSLILRKATLDVAHGGGKRFDTESPEYRVLHSWLIQGAGDDDHRAPRLTRLQVSPQSQVLVEPHDRLHLSVQAHFADGSVRDVRRMAVYEVSNPSVDISAGGLVRRTKMGETVVTVRFLQKQQAVRLAFIPARPDFAWSGPIPANFVDEHVFAKLKSLRINPSPIAGDALFLRRAYLDVIGVLPTAAEAREFAADSSPDKRTRLIDALLERPEFADFWAQKWSDLLRNEEKTLDRKGVENFYHWIRLRVARNDPWDEFVRDLIVARGSTYSAPAANFYRAMRDPFTRAESTAQLFLGVRLQCAKCHNHPFDRWTQDDYYGWANLFAQVDYKILENRRRDRNDKHEFIGEQIVMRKAEGDVTNARTGQPARSRVLGDNSIEIAEGSDRLSDLAAWLTRPGQRAVREVSGQSRVVSFDGAGRCRTNRRFSRHKSTVQPGAARCAGCGLRRRPIRLEAASLQDYGVEDVSTLRVSERHQRRRRTQLFTNHCPPVVGGTVDRCRRSSSRRHGIIQWLSSGYAGRRNPRRARRAVSRSATQPWRQVSDIVWKTTTTAAVRVRTSGRGDAEPNVRDDRRTAAQRTLDAQRQSAVAVNFRGDVGFRFHRGVVLGGIVPAANFCRERSIYGAHSISTESPPGVGRCRLGGVEFQRVFVATVRWHAAERMHIHLSQIGVKNARRANSISPLIASISRSANRPANRWPRFDGSDVAPVAFRTTA